METLRRATIYAAQDKQVAEQLLTALVERTTASGGAADPLAWFDAGYLIESYRQASHIYKWDMLSSAERAKWALRSEPKGPDGYSFVTKAIAMSGKNPEMEFAASLMKDGATRRRTPPPRTGRAPSQVRCSRRTWEEMLNDECLNAEVNAECGMMNAEVNYSLTSAFEIQHSALLLCLPV